MYSERLESSFLLLCLASSSAPSASSPSSSAVTLSITWDTERFKSERGWKL